MTKPEKPAPPSSQKQAGKSVEIQTDEILPGRTPSKAFVGALKTVAGAEKEQDK